MAEDREQLSDQGASAAVVYIANCPEHGLHGERDDCFVCGKEVQHTVFVRSDMYLDIRGRLERERDELRRENRRLLAERNGFHELLDHFDRYASVPDKGEYNGSPFQAKVRTALGSDEEGHGHV